MRVLITVLIIIVSSASAANLLPPEIQRCHLSDPKFNDCMARNIEKGLIVLSKGYKPLGLTPFEPHPVEKIQISGARAGSVTLDQLYENVDIYNSTSVEILEANIDVDKCEWKMKIITPLSVMKADYAIKGQLLVFPINSQGKCTVTLKDIMTNHKVKCERVQKKGKTYFNLLSYEITMDPKYVHYDYGNVFPSNEQIEKEIIKTMNENALSIFNDVKAGFEEVFGALYRNLINRIFAKISVDELFLP